MFVCLYPYWLLRQFQATATPVLARALVIVARDFTEELTGMSHLDTYSCDQSGALSGHYKPALPMPGMPRCSVEHVHVSMFYGELRY